MINQVQKWINARIKERTTLDGVSLIAAGILLLILKPNRFNCCLCGNSIWWLDYPNQSNYNLLIGNVYWMRLYQIVLV